MANWCDNNITLFHEDREVMKAFAEKCEAEYTISKGGRSFFCEINDERAFIQWCKYDGENTIEIYVQSAWSPCEPTLEKLIEQGFEVLCGTYCESGMGICGYHFGDEFEFDDFDKIPSELLTEFAIENPADNIDN